MLAKLVHHATGLRGTARSRALAMSVLAIAAFAAADAGAASFNCQRKPSSYSASERIACQDAEISRLDDRLAVAYQRAFEQAADPRAIAAMRDQQWQWRQANCKDRECVQSWYERRIAELDADLKHAKGEQRAAFERSVADQQLAPGAADALRIMKHDHVDVPATAETAAPVAAPAAAPVSTQPAPAAAAAAEKHVAAPVSAEAPQAAADTAPAKSSAEKLADALRAQAEAEQKPATAPVATAPAAPVATAAAGTVVDGAPRVVNRQDAQANPVPDAPAVAAAAPAGKSASYSEYAASKKNDGASNAAVNLMEQPMPAAHLKQVKLVGSLAPRDTQTAANAKADVPPQVDAATISQ